MSVKSWLPAVGGAVLLLLSGCATTPLPAAALPTAPRVLPPELQARILALDPEQVTETDLRETLALAPAPQVINIHGGIYPVYRAMKSFAEFLAGMGYPEASTKLPDGRTSFSCYDPAASIAGATAWYYERTGLRPMIVGHSQGGMQAVKVLHYLAGNFATNVLVWNPVTQTPEPRGEITDPLTGKSRPVIGFQLAYVTAVGAGGLTRALPNQWDLVGKLRVIPDSAEEFTGFYFGLDLFGGDALGFGSANCYQAEGKAVVRNVQLPTWYHHGTVPCTAHLAKVAAVRDWINNYNTPADQPEFNETFSTGTDTDNILWAADVWHSIKRHWVRELQNLIRAQRHARQQ
jgi:pimeloyl-ACP methyl ester carboxylesterase